MNVVRVSESARYRVHLDRPARISQEIRGSRAKGPTPDIDLRGSSRALAVAFIPDPAPESISAGPHFFAGRFARCPAEGCSSPKDVVNYQFPGQYPWQEPAPLRIPAGDYMLYVVTDDEPASVIVRLEGLSGRVRLRASEDAAAEVGDTEESVFSSADGTTYAGGATYSAGTRGLIVGTVWGSAAAATRFDFGLCTYAGPAVPPPNVAYGPGCEQLTGAAAHGYMSDASSFDITFMTDYQPDMLSTGDGQHGFGGWIKSPDMTSAGTQGLLLDLS